MELDTSKIDDATLALLFLGLHDGARVWKGFDWEAMDRLHQACYITDPRSKAKSVVFTEEGLERARLCEEMFGKRFETFERSKPSQQLDPPPVALLEADAVEVLRVWAVGGGPQQLALRTCWNDPGAWGLLLVDIARHVAQAYQREGKDAGEALRRIRELFDAEWSSPTDIPLDLTDDI